MQLHLSMRELRGDASGEAATVVAAAVNSKSRWAAMSQGVGSIDFNADAVGTPDVAAVDDDDDDGDDGDGDDDDDDADASAAAWKRCSERRDIAWEKVRKSAREHEST